MTQPFVIRIEQAALDDLQARLARTRWAEDFANDDWGYGSNAAYLKELVAHWRTGYDWRAAEAEMNRLPHFRSTIDGVPIHYIRQPGRSPRPMPLLLNHGWPWTFWDYRKLIGPLADPAAHGGDEADAFDVVVPSLPGFGFSSPLRQTGVNFTRTADLWVALMQRELGYPRFATHGGDWGSFVSAQLGHKFADRLIGVHLHFAAPLDFMNGGTVPKEDFDADELPLRRANGAFARTETGYSALQSTRPQSLAFALEDSPVGLAAWLVEKRRRWSDCGGEVERRFSKDDLLTGVMIYWLTQTAGSSARYYAEALRQPWQPSHDRLPVVEAPTGLALFPGEIYRQPRRWLRRYYNLQHCTTMPSGGHFAPMEEPERLIEDIRAFFRPLRDQPSV